MTGLRRLGGCKPKPAEFRFDSQYTPEPMCGCWLWIGTLRGQHGYGSIKIEGKNTGAHRFSYAKHVGPIPDGMLVLHRCDVPSCVNPAHLFLGSQQDNEDDKVRKGRQARGAWLASRQSANRPRGESNGNSKLTRDLAQAIRLESGSQRFVAKKYGVSQALVSKIQRKELWK